MWMTNQETQFVMPLTGSQKPPVFVIETGTFHRKEKLGSTGHRLLLSLRGLVSFQP